MKILLLGPNGQVGWELQRALAPLGQVLPLTRRERDGYCGDLSAPEKLSAAIQAITPEVIVNAAAYTSVDQAESEPQLARTVNAQSPGVMATEAQKVGSLLVHYSTDYIFSGAGSRPWGEDDTPEPVNVYGRTKLEGEEAVRRSGCRHLIFRTSWVYALRGRNFLHTILKLACERESLRVVDDQIGAPTGAELIADVTAHALRSLREDAGLAGTYHLAAAGETSWWGYARLAVARAAELGMAIKPQVRDITPVPSEEFSTPAPRPRNSRLDTSRLERAFGLRMPPWEQGVCRVLGELKAAG